MWIFGQQSEPLAKKCFEQTTVQIADITGLVEHENENWLGSSLD